MDNQQPYFKFYVRMLRELLKRGVLDRAMSVLVVAGGVTDQAALRELGFTKVTISNLDARMKADEFAPYQWSFQDAEKLTYPDEAFDAVVICAGLHHCHSPHRALLECYRVARRAAVVLEARDGFLSRIAVRLGVVDEYEVHAVVGNNFTYGGVANTSLPNYIYRWTEREVEKTIASHAPHAPPRMVFFHEFAPPLSVLRVRKTARGLVLMFVAWPALWVITRLFPSQCNLFGFAVLKPELPRELFPWVKLDNGKPVINREWAEARYNQAGKPAPPAKL